MLDRQNSVRLSVAAPLGAAAAALVGVTVGWPYAPAAGWIVAAFVYLLWTWLLVGGMTAAQTEAHATHKQEKGDSTPWVTDVAVVVASIASLAGVGYLLAAGSDGGDTAAAVVGILSVAASWLTVHTVFTLRYARAYYPAGGIDFHQDGTKPDYLDFAYLAFTVGMTYQVSDTDVTSRAIRRAVLSQALVSFLFGAVILAMTLNLVVGLAK